MLSLSSCYMQYYTQSHMAQPCGHRLEMSNSNKYQFFEKYTVLIFVSSVCNTKAFNVCFKDSDTMKRVIIKFHGVYGLFYSASDIN